MEESGNNLTLVQKKPMEEIKNNLVIEKNDLKKNYKVGRRVKSATLLTIKK